jgi:hypothetical protein
MSEEQKSKICPFCEGRIAIESMSCNYCGSQLDNVVHLHRDQNDLFSDEGFDSVLTPAYLDEAQKEQTDPEYESTESKDKAPAGKGVFSLFLVALAIQLSTIALLLLFFAEEGALVFEFNSAYWPVYLFVALPMLYWGLQSFDDLDKESSSES